MDYQSIVDSVSLPCSVLSVERTENGDCGEIRIVCFNRAYRTLMGSDCQVGILYQELTPRDSRFEEFCFQAAVLKRPMHIYLEYKPMNCWTDQTLLPLTSDREEQFYCLLTLEVNAEADADQMASVPIEVAQSVIEASVMLMAADNVKSGVSDALQVIRDTAQAQAVSITLIDHEQQDVIRFCECFQPWSRLKRGVFPYKLMQSWQNVIPPCNSLVLKEEDDLEQLREQEPGLYQVLIENEVSSLMLIPLQSDKSVVGYLFVLNFATEKVIEISEVVELVAFFIATEISNYLLVQRLEILSNLDALTGVHNRHAMSKRVREMAQSAEIVPYGVINIDLNGLKRVNDTQGHEAGDALLVRAAALLQKTFHLEDLFRTGGDEFVVIQRGVSEQKFEEQVRRLRQSVEAQDEVSFAMGHFWSNGLDDTTYSLRIADERMYENKKAFHKLHPELERK